MGKKKSANEFDPYREALVVETQTVWPESFDRWEADQRRSLEEKLHADPENAAILDYVRQHTGFCRQITVTDADVDRLG